jgi:hypothetical protein
MQGIHRCNSPPSRPSHSLILYVGGLDIRKNRLQVGLTCLSLVDASTEQLGLLDSLGCLVVLLATLRPEKAPAGAFVSRDLQADRQENSASY